MSSLAPHEFAPETTYLNTAAFGLPSARALAAVREASAEWAAGRGGPLSNDVLVPEVRASFARLLAGATPDDVAIGGGVAPLIAPIAVALPAGAEVLLAEGEFSSVSMPFLYRGDLAVRFVPLERLAEEVRPETALVAVSVVQSADGRITDLPVLRAATQAHGARLLVDATQAASWLPLSFADADYWVCATFKWLIGARSLSFFAAAPEAAATVRPVGPSWYAAADRWAELYRPVALASTTHRFDATPDWLGVIAATAGLSLIEELTVEKINAHNLDLADRFRAGLTEIGLESVPGRSAIVSVLGAGDAAPRLEQAGVIISARNGGLRFAFHLYNDVDDVDRALEVLAAE
ncbi:aminotransferase class V-fold PLP-dependent enzyme [Nocardia iowensis]|uniref:Aminotransferase class V-fold PLP-dependent enzyme n=1 Tax=Nocardia iowensis TaxID=204891 RepID=A0ABX8S326_NOCIO|nr:aminotransferase class V-fold PLP-dependent enzyme [Nocardia iowensis]QXN95045.1 aminotransferase class V-fold PLP-dependent enzyme [Nocardia iowensis]